MIFATIQSRFKMVLLTGVSRLQILLQNTSLNFPRFSLSCTNISSKNSIYTSSIQKDLMEFFDDKNNWGEREVRVGRSWKKEELRIKSNSDLHKLWYVLLKEKNMLLTMQHECKSKDKSFPNPERIDKVEESMENLEEVVRERNTAYYELETGEKGERPFGFATNCFGLPYKYKMREFLVPKQLNSKFLKDEKLHNYTDDHEYVQKFLARLEEKKERISRRKKRRQYEYVCKLLRTFPNIDEEAVREKFPDVDFEKAKQDPLSRGHGVNHY